MARERKRTKLTRGEQGALLLGGAALLAWLARGSGPAAKGEKGASSGGERAGGLPNLGITGKPPFPPIARAAWVAVVAVDDSPAATLDGKTYLLSKGTLLRSTGKTVALGGGTATERRGSASASVDVGSDTIDEVTLVRDTKAKDEAANNAPADLAAGTTLRIVDYLVTAKSAP